MIISISGKIGSGKDLTAQIIQCLCFLKEMNIPYSISAVNYNLEKHFTENNYYGKWQVKKYAGKLKEIVALLTGCTVRDLENQDFKNKELGDEWINTNSVINGYDISKPPKYRELLQWIGTEAMRNVIHQNVWVNALFSDYNEESKWIISDMRFPNEMEAVKKRGGITIRIERPNTNKGTHPSETALDNVEFDYVIQNDGTKEDLIEKVYTILKKQNIL